MAKATLKSVAAEVGVSPATVSNAYNRPDQLSAELRERVFETARKLGYPGPNPTARNLRSGRTGSFGLLYNHSLRHAFSDPFATEFLGGIGGVIEADGSALMLIPLKPGTRQFNLDLLRLQAVDGLADVCLDTQQAQAVQEFAEQRGIPFISSCASEPGFDFVGPDDHAAGLTLTEHIRSLGHRHVGMVVDVDCEEGLLSPDAHPDFAGWDRLSALQEGLPDTTLTIVNARWNARDAGARAGAHLLDRAPRPTAIIGLSDVLALGVLDAARERGIDVPRELSVCGFDDIPEAQRAGLTTIAQPITQRGELVGKLLLDPKAGPRRIFLPTELKVRRTTGPANERNS